MKKYLFLFSLLVAVSAMHAQVVSAMYQDSLFSSQYQTDDGILDGPYTSYYKNGIKKSHGILQYGNRVGPWSIWDSTGKLKLTRNYTNPYEYTRTFPKDTNPPVYTLKRDSLGEWKEFRLTEKMIAYQERDFKYFYTDEKQVFLNCETLYKLLYLNALKKKFDVYDFGKDIDDGFTKKLDISTIDTSKYKLIGFRIKSDLYFDDVRFVSKEYVLAITVIVVPKANPKEAIDLFSVPYRDIRHILVQEKVVPPNKFDHTQANYIQNYDDIFFFSAYEFSKYKIRHAPTGYNTIPEHDATVTPFLLSRVELENNLWLRFNK